MLVDLWNDKGQAEVISLILNTYSRLSRVKFWPRTDLPIEPELDCRICRIDDTRPTLIEGPADETLLEKATIPEFGVSTADEERAIAERLAKLQETTKPLTMDRLQNMFRPGSAPGDRPTDEASVEPPINPKP